MIAIAALLFTLLSCHKKEQVEVVNGPLVGTWKLKEILADPGDGSGKFMAVTSDKQLTFDNNGKVTCNGAICYLTTQSNKSSSGTYDETNSTITSADCQKYNVKYELTGNTLILFYPFYEAFQAKFIKAQ